MAANHNAAQTAGLPPLISKVLADVQLHHKEQLVRRQMMRERAKAQTAYLEAQIQNNLMSSRKSAEAKAEERLAADADADDHQKTLDQAKAKQSKTLHDLHAQLAAMQQQAAAKQQQVRRLALQRDQARLQENMMHDKQEADAELARKQEQRALYKQHVQHNRQVVKHSKDRRRLERENDMAEEQHQLKLASTVQDRLEWERAEIHRRVERYLSRPVPQDVMSPQDAMMAEHRKASKAIARAMQEEKARLQASALKGMSQRNIYQQDLQGQ
eukprot:gene1584-2838_t